jgi:HAD superfamily hydrolase (TIGR01459 family)
MHAAPPPVRTGIASLVASYDMLLCDVWGVVHNGATAHPAAVDALRRARAAGVTVMLITNAPRPGTVIERQIERFGVPRDCYDAAIASGDVARDELRRRPGARVFHLGPERDLPNYEGLDVTLVDFDEADVVVCTGFFNDDVETPADYADMLMRIRARGLPFICANPDIVVERGDRLIWCAGALARDYETLGGKAIYAGKPHAPIYHLALERAAKIRGKKVDPDRVLAIGDGLHTDLAGAVAQGFDCLFVASAIHAADLDPDTSEENPASYTRMFAAAGLWPMALTWRLAW